MLEPTVQYYISPSFTHEKLGSPNYADLVDVFEDRTRGWFFLPASKLLDTPNCDIAAVALLVNYFEGIEIYLTGEDSRNRSADFFAKGFGRVFSVGGEDLEFSRKIATAMYQQARCGFAHDGMFRNRVFFSRGCLDPILITWPKKDGVFDHSGDVESIVINPPRFLESIKIHFDRYIKQLRDGADAAIKPAFESAVALKWGLGERAPFIGMTHDKFFSA